MALSRFDAGLLDAAIGMARRCSYSPDQLLDAVPAREQGPCRVSTGWVRRRVGVRFPRLNAPSEASTRHPLLFRLVAMLLPVLLVSLGLVAAGGLWANAASAATGCSASYATQSQWSGGLVAGVTVTNTGTSALT